MRWMLLLLALVFSRTARAEPTPEGTVMLGLAELSLAVDYLQTTSAMHAGLREKNPLLGPHPSDTRTLAYFSGCMLATAGATYLLPEKWSAWAPALVLLVQIPQ